MGRGGLFEKNTRLRERPNLWLMVFRFIHRTMKVRWSFLSPDTLKKGGRTLEPEIPVSR